MERQIMIIFRNGNMYRMKFEFDYSLSMAISETIANAVAFGYDIERISCIKPEIIGDNNEENILANVREML